MPLERNDLKMNPESCALLALFAWSIVPTCVAALDVIQPDFPPLQTAFLFSLIGVLALAITFAAVPKMREMYLENFLGYASRPKHIVRFMLLGLFGTIVYYPLYVLSFNYLSPPEVSALNYTWPVFLLLFGYLFRRWRAKVEEKPNSRRLVLELLGLITTSFGAFLVITKGSILSINANVGVFYIIIAAASQALFFFLPQTVWFDYDEPLAVFAGLATGVPILGLFSFFSGTMSFPVNNWAWSPLFLIGVVGVALGYVMSLRALTKGETLRVIGIIYLVPIGQAVLAVLWEALIQGAGVSAFKLHIILGIACVFFARFFFYLSDDKTRSSDLPKKSK